jgi:hypothetical protein
MTLPALSLSQIAYLTLRERNKHTKLTIPSKLTKTDFLTITRTNHLTQSNNQTCKSLIKFKEIKLQL